MNFPKRLLTVLAICAFLWVVVRAWNQAITIDEADTYLAHASSRSLGFPHPNNHVLNTRLIRFSTRAFGVSAFTLRIPALLGAVVYLWAVVRLCRLLSAQWFVQALLFLSLVLNPLVGDFLVAARGYGLALGFLMLGIVYAAERLLPAPGPQTWTFCAIPSACFGISFSANFSFAFVDAAAMAAVFLAAWKMRSAALPKLLAASALPAIAMTWLITRSTIFEFPTDQLWYGAKSLRETFRTVAEGSLYRPNPDFLSPEIVAFLDSIQPVLLPFLLLASVACTGALVIARTRDWRLHFAAALVGITAVALGIHWIAYRTSGLLLPQDRTAIYLPPLLTAAAGSILAISGLSFYSRLLRGVQVTAFVLLGSYFLACLRTDHFKEWIWDSESDRTYAILACLNHEYQVRDITSIWMYVSVLKFYQAGSRGREDFQSIIDWRDNPPPTQVYVVNHLFDQNIIADKRLTLIYQGPSNVAIGVTPELAGKLQPSACLEAAGVTPRE